MDQLIQLLALTIVRLVQFIQPFLLPICFVSAWAFVVLVIWNVVAATRDGVSKAKQLHQIPCANCTYFTNSHFLKCPIHPASALTEEAIGCMDFESAKSLGKIKDTTSV